MPYVEHVVKSLSPLPGMAVGAGQELPCFTGRVTNGMLKSRPHFMFRQAFFTSIGKIVVPRNLAPWQRVFAVAAYWLALLTIPHALSICFCQCILFV